jgi:hypothetical protein
VIWLVLVVLAGGVLLARALDREARPEPPIPPQRITAYPVRWVLVQPADPAAPTVAELQAGLDLTCFIQPTSTGEPR